MYKPDLYDTYEPYEFVMERDPSVIKKYKKEYSGCVYLTHRSKGYGVTVIDNFDCYNEVVRHRFGMDINAAEEFFNIACRYIREEIKWCEPAIYNFACGYNKSCSKICTPENCPSVLGGTSYHEIFSKSCNFRKSKTK